jgi:hypothetical protein
MQCLEFDKINEKGTFEATEHDKYEHIEGSVWFSLLGNMFILQRFALSSGLGGVESIIHYNLLLLGRIN